MPNFAPTEEQEEIRGLARSLANEQLRPRGREAEAQGDSAPALQQTLSQTGLTTPFPEAYGGSGPIEAVTYTLIAEELSFGDGGLALNIIGSLAGPLAVTLAGSEQQQDQYVRPFCAEHAGSQRRGSLAFAERTGGYRLADISASVRREGDNYILNGSKRDVVHGAHADLRVVLARLEGTSGNEGLCALMLPPESEGLHIQADELKLGLRAAPTASYTFENVSIPADCLLGEPGGNGVVRGATLYTILRAGLACGTARAALEYAIDYARQRIAFGRPIASYQGIAFMVSEMAMKLDAARLLTWRAAASWDRGESGETLVREAEAAHHQALKIAQSATTDAIQIMGGAGFMQDHPAEMWMRNAAAME
ncbi:MAG: acyl-CoA dehydrogenase family protein [Ktedonobacteraceae bacterium]